MNPQAKVFLRGIKFSKLSFFQLRRDNEKFATSLAHASKVMLKILQARLQQYTNREVPDVQAGFRKGRGTRDQIANKTGSSKKQESSRKTSISALLTTPKPLTMWITTDWKILQEMGIPAHLTCLLRNQ